MMSAASPSLSSAAAGARRGATTTTMASRRPPSLVLSSSSSSVRARPPRPAAALRARAAAREANEEVEVRPGVYQGYWTWRPSSGGMQGEAHRIRYTRADGGDAGAGDAARLLPPVVLLHGFGSNADQWRKTVGKLRNPTYAVDLLGYGLSDKPDPRLRPPNAIYNFANWGALVGDFLDAVVLRDDDDEAPSSSSSSSSSSSAPGSTTAAVAAAAAAGEMKQQDAAVMTNPGRRPPTKAFLSANSVGGLAALEAAIARPDAVAGVQVLNISLRGLHVDRQLEWQRPLVAAFQRLLRDTPLGEAFFASVAQPQTVRNILRQAYGVKEAVTDELIDCILTPGLQPGAARVFLDFISYSGGPLPETLMAALPAQIPLSVVWGKEDPWEDVVQGRALFARYAEEFVELEGVGHCPMDEAPERVNPLIAAFAERHADKAFFAAEAVGAASAVRV